MLTQILAMLLATEAPQATAPAAAPATGQAAFDAAMAALAEQRYGDALSGFTALETRSAVQRNPQVHGTILLRKGAALHGLIRNDEAESALRTGLKILPPDESPGARWDRYSAEHTLGLIEKARFNYIAAAEHFRAAVTLADEPMPKARSLLALATVKMFDSANEALSHADEAVRLVEAQGDVSKDGKKRRADAQTVRARVMLNAGQAKDAYAVLQKAVADQGGLDLKVNYNEIITRSDLALAALIAGKDDDARRYLAYTGAGRMEKSPFDLAVGMASPPCGGPANLTPGDVAVVEFSILPDGTVSDPLPIYSSIQGPAAIEFSQAVANWSWRPEDAAKIPALFRATTRVELRCSTSVPRPQVEHVLNAEYGGWLTEQKIAVLPEAASSAADVALMRAEIARRRSIGGLSPLPALVRLGTNPVIPSDEQQALLVEARDLAVKQSAPPAVVALIEIRLAQAMRPRQRNAGEQVRTQLRALLARPDLAGDAKAANTLRLMISDPGSRLQPPQDASILLNDVIADPRLSAGNPLKVGALIRLAALQAKAGDRVAAFASFGKTGLAERQCALLDAEPALIRDNIGSGSYPMDAMRWGFEGWVRMEYDIEATGKTSAQRPIIAYPPFVFREAATQITKGLSYTQSFRPDGSAGCGGQQENVRFISGR